MEPTAAPISVSGSRVLWSSDDASSVRSACTDDRLGRRRCSGYCGAAQYARQQAGRVGRHHQPARERAKSDCGLDEADEHKTGAGPAAQPSTPVTKPAASADTTNPPASAPKATADSTKPTSTKPAPDPKADDKTKDGDFKPSEQVSEDQAVAYPVDI